MPADANSFYCRPEPKFRNGDWYSAVPVVKNTLHNIMKNISIMTGWDQSKLWTGTHCEQRLLENNCDEAGIKHATDNEQVRPYNNT